MGLPTYGFWSDPETITDPKLLLDIARRDPRAAIGVLANRHLTGPAFTEAVSKAEFLVKNIDYGGPLPIMRDRSATEQMQILTAAVERSVPCATIIAHAASPQTRLMVWNTWRHDRRVAVREFAENAATDMSVANMRYWHTPGFLTALDLLAAAGLLDEGTMAGNQARLLRIGHRLLSATSRDDLADLGPQLHTMPHDYWHLAHQRVAEYPDLAFEWALTGHPACARQMLDHPTLTRDEVAQIAAAHRGDAAIQATAAAHPATDADQARARLLEAITLTVDAYLDGTGTGDLTQHQRELRNMPANWVRAVAVDVETLLNETDVTLIGRHLTEAFPRHYNKSVGMLLLARWSERDPSVADDIGIEAWQARIGLAHTFISGHIPPTPFTISVVEKLLHGRIPCGRLGGLNSHDYRVSDVVSWWRRLPVDQRPNLDLGGYREGLSAGEDGNGVRWHDFLRQCMAAELCGHRDQVSRLTSAQQVVALWDLHRRAHAHDTPQAERQQLDEMNLAERIDHVLEQEHLHQAETVEVRHHELFANALGGI